jgi:hypothetical protein
LPNFSKLGKMNEARRAALNIWEFDEDEQLLGLGEKGKKVIGHIANHMYKLHHARYFCGELKDRVFIDPPKLYITFIYLAECSEDKSILRTDIQNDSFQFRSFVGMLLFNEPRMRRV